LSLSGGFIPPRQWRHQAASLTQRPRVRMAGDGFR
jgi:hypothetical protein